MNTCDVLIYDEESDRHVRITWRDALNAATLGLNSTQLVFEATDDVLMAGSKGGEVQTLAQWADVAEKWARFNEGEDITYSDCVASGGRDVRIVLARPFIEHLMHSVVLTVAGRDTGATLFGPAGARLHHTHTFTVRRSRPSSARWQTCSSRYALHCHSLLGNVPNVNRLPRCTHPLALRTVAPPPAAFSVHTVPIAPLPCLATRARAFRRFGRPTPKSRRSRVHACPSNLSGSRTRAARRLSRTRAPVRAGHYTGHFKAVVTKPQNVMVMRDVSCSGYVAGGNTKFFCNPNNPSVENTVRAIQNRLSFTDTDDPHPSLLAFACLHGQVEHSQIDTVMSVTTRQLPWDVTGSSPGNHKSFPGGEQVFRWYNQKLNLGQIHYGEDVQATENVEFLTQGSTNNAVCFVGPHRLYDPFTKSFMSLVPGQGHFGPDAIPGVRARLAPLPSPCAPHHWLARPTAWQDARWRRGESVSLKAARDAMVSLELAQHAQMVYSKP